MNNNNLDQESTIKVLETVAELALKLPKEKQKIVIDQLAEQLQLPQACLRNPASIQFLALALSLSHILQLSSQAQDLRLSAQKLLHTSLDNPEKQSQEMLAVLASRQFEPISAKISRLLSTPGEEVEEGDLERKGVIITLESLGPLAQAKEAGPLKVSDACVEDILNKFEKMDLRPTPQGPHP